MSWQYAVVAVAVLVAGAALFRAIRAQFRSGCDSGACGCGHTSPDPFPDRRAKSTPLVSINVNSPARSSGRDEPPC